jgi:NAD(P)-dependent dehydrogenase (short-subunit alcohol dehydrogenase family)
MGLASARAFPEAGAAVALLDIDADAVHAATDQLNADGHRVLGLTWDVSSEEQVAAAVEQTTATFGPLDMA